MSDASEDGSKVTDENGEMSHEVWRNRKKDIISHENSATKESYHSD